MSLDSKRAREIFVAAVADVPAEQWDAYVAQVCEGDAELAGRVRQLLRAHAGAGNFLEAPFPLPGAAAAPLGEGPGSIVGPYKLLEQIGEGGFGVVFMAEQQQPVRRKVALKVLKPGMDSRQVVARFEAERQALALMDHPNIARVLDAGENTGGRPYFVMELVRGVPITDYCDQARLTPRQRLELFVSVCQAVQHAHQKGIIHRDLKPSNVLVTLHDGTPVVKVIDFGIAKALGEPLTDKTLCTGFAQLVGTPLYMSPEQAALSGLDVDTRTDVYALGVLLYELLTGTTPFDRERLRAAAYDEICRIIREEEPPRPSKRLSTLGATLTAVSAQRGTEPNRLGQLVKGELDWIVMKCLEKDRNRRYETANSLAHDIERYLHDEPVQACPPTALYRFRKFARRNKAALAMGTVVLAACVAVVGAVAGSIGWAVRDRAARQAAVGVEVGVALKEAERLQAQRKYAEALSAARRAAGLMAGGGHEYRRHVRDLRHDLEMALRLEKIRLEVPETSGGDFDFAQEDAAYAEAFRRFGIDAEALEPREAADRIRATTIPVELAWALDDWAFVRGMVRGRGDGGRKKLVAAARLADPDGLRNRIRDAQESNDVRALRDLVVSEEFNTLRWPTVNLLGLALWQSGQFEQVVVLMRRAQRQHADDFWFNLMLGALLARREPAQAIRYYTAALALRPESPAVRINLAWLLANCPRTDLRDPPEAVELAGKAVGLTPQEAFAWTVLGAARYRAGRWQAAVAALRKSMELRRGGDGSGRFFLAMAHRRLGNRDEARKWYGRAVAWMEKHKPRDEDLRRFRAEAEALLRSTQPSGR